MHIESMQVCSEQPVHRVFVLSYKVELTTPMLSFCREGKEWRNFSASTEAAFRSMFCRVRDLNRLPHEVVNEM